MSDESREPSGGPSQWSHHLRLLKCLPYYKEIEWPETRKHVWNQETQFEAWKVVVKFMMDIGRMQVNWKYDALPDILHKLHHEDERQIPVRVKLIDLCPDLEIWTIHGRLTQMAIRKPKYVTSFQDMEERTLLMIFEEHQDRVVEMSVKQGMAEYMHMIAWYALWRKWPVQYWMWAWATDVPDIGNPWKVKILGYSDIYEKMWVKVGEKDPKYPLMDNQVDWNYDSHVCYWEQWIQTMSSDTYMPKVSPNGME